MYKAIRGSDLRNPRASFVLCGNDSKNTHWPDFSRNWKTREFRWRNDQQLNETSMCDSGAPDFSERKEDFRGLAALNGTGWLPTIVKRTSDADFPQS